MGVVWGSVAQSEISSSFFMLDQVELTIEFMQMKEMNSSRDSGG